MDTFNLHGQMITVEIQKAFDTIGHNVLIAAFAKYGSGLNFKSLVNTLLHRRSFADLFIFISSINSFQTSSFYTLIILIITPTIFFKLLF